MRFPTSFAVILVAATSVATAQPKQEVSGGRVSLSEKEADAPRDAPRHPQEWVELADPSPAKHGRVFVVVGREAGDFGMLRLDASKGQVKVKDVTVHYVDGGAKVYKVNKTIDARRKKSAYVDLLSPKVIDRVVIHTDRRGKGEYVLYGTATAGQIATR